MTATNMYHYTRIWLSIQIRFTVFTKSYYIDIRSYSTNANKTTLSIKDTIIHINIYLKCKITYDETVIVNIILKNRNMKNNLKYTRKKKCFFSTNLE